MYIVLLYVLEANLNSQRHNNARLTTRVISKQGGLFLKHTVCLLIMSFRHLKEKIQCVAVNLPLASYKFWCYNVNSLTMCDCMADM